MAWRIALVVGWVAVLVGLVLVPSDDGLAYGIGGVVLTIAAGALASRWWMVAVPSIVTVLLVGGIFLLIGGCDQDCGGDDGFWAIVTWFLLVFTAPATVAMAVGVGARRMMRGEPG